MTPPTAHDLWLEPIDPGDRGCAECGTNTTNPTRIIDEPCDEATIAVAAGDYFRPIYCRACCPCDDCRAETTTYYTQNRFPLTTTTGESPAIGGAHGASPEAAPPIATPTPNEAA